MMLGMRKKKSVSTKSLESVLMVIESVTRL